ncbi:ImmA/IrrE family metallo-endopeptidase [Dinghuibacter silviterrae]|uniref:Uncharacterized protein DUF955 n=1 Tax=Dinghuibacter silviterrae TaxID=1539049 RepID=A0A4R8DHH8_9BACT|nr:ImmA/IrrE family metallo-endopeptidase [Dinghuibacter silviterrae]TDW96566.1 uncharacterized protein DUF955 [Dinghuibacter silviterrae]
MKHLTSLMLAALFMMAVKKEAYSQSLNYLSSEYLVTEDNTICSQAQANFAMDIDLSKTNLANILEALNLSAYKVDVVMCNQIRHSALAYLDHNTGRKYILINGNMLSDLDTRYYSHLFIIAHEFSHLYLNHFEQTDLTQENKRRMELEADKNAAMLVKKLGGAIDDCYYALDQLHHPTVDTYYDHPTKDKRYAAVLEGWNMDAPAPTNTVYSNYTDYFNDLDDISLLKYTNNVGAYDFNHYKEKHPDMQPKSIFYYQNAYWVVWEKAEAGSASRYYWNYDEFPQQDIQSYLDNGYRYQFIERINDAWFIVLRKSSNQPAQKTVDISKYDLENFTRSYSSLVVDNLKAGYTIQNLIENSNGNYTIFFTYTGNQTWALNFFPTYDELISWQHNMENQNFNFMSFFKYVDGRFFGFMVNDPQVNNWHIRALDVNSLDEVKNFIKDGFSVANITADPEYIRLTLAKGN